MVFEDFCSFIFYPSTDISACSHHVLPIGLGVACFVDVLLPWLKGLSEYLLAVTGNTTVRVPT